MTGQAEDADVRLAAAVARAAGDLLRGLRADGRAEGRELGRLGDARAKELICERLRAARGDDAILSEESADDPARLNADRVWIVDPLDGTREYGMPGRTDWAVHIALTRSTRAAPINTPGSEPTRMFAISVRSTLPAAASSAAGRSPSANSSKSSPAIEPGNAAHRQPHRKADVDRAAVWLWLRRARGRPRRPPAKSAS